MTGIRAFVGHSFASGDANVVRLFLDYLDTIVHSGIDFAWQHAEEAEPRVVAEKVLCLLSDKNLFIGICTKKEKVIDSAVLKPSLFFNRLTASRNEFKWKTSDWIIQEIGLSIGLKLDVILLVENGVRSPGGLQGNLEYITFERDVPEKSFAKLLQMINKLVPRSKLAGAQSGDAVAVSDDDAGQSAGSDADSELSPERAWKQTDYQWAVFRAMLRKDEPKIRAIRDAYLLTEMASDSDNRLSWDAACEFGRIAFFGRGDLSKVRKQALEHPDHGRTLEFYGRALEHYKEYENASEFFLKAAGTTEDVPQKGNLLRMAISARASAGQLEDVVQMLDSMRELVAGSPELETDFLNSVKHVADLGKFNHLFLAVMERAAEIDPGNCSALFSLAHKASEEGFNDLSLYHYLRIPEDERTSAMWNNLGVSYEEFSAPALAVGAYKNSELKGETLAVSNLANRLIHAGFLAEARVRCEKALEENDCHKNVMTTLARIAEILPDEEKALVPTLSAARQGSDFFRRMGRNLSRTMPAPFSRAWSIVGCTLDVSIADNQFAAVGYREDLSEGGFTRLVNPNDQPVTTIRTRVEYSGEVIGRSVVGRVKRNRVDSPYPSSLLSTDGVSSILLTLSDDEETFYVMEYDQPRKRTFYEIKKLREGPEI